MNSYNPFPSAAPDFSDPLGLLRACHERIFQHCDRLEALARHLGDKGADLEAQQAAAGIHRYFSTAARHHHVDEEEEFFPRLSKQTPELANLIRQLEQEHQQLDALWAELAPLLESLTDVRDIPALQTLAQRLAQSYRGHAQRENESVLASARQLLSGDELTQMGHNMAARRGVMSAAGL